MGTVETAALSLFGAVGSSANTVVQSDRAAKETKRAGRRQAAALRAEAAAERERGRRLQASQRAAFGAAGGGQQGSALFVTSQAVLENIRARERILVGAQNVQKNASAQAEAIRLQGYSQAFTDLTNTATSSAKFFL